MSNFPDGIITLLFTDIEGSTRLLERLGEKYIELLETHRSLLRDAFQAFDGQEVMLQGDSSFVVFAHAQQAVSAAAEAQRALREDCWPPDSDIHVRMGLHTGQPVLVGNDYVGVDVHHAARLMAAASGGQVLLSQSTLDAINDDWPVGLKVLSLGRHQLKDISQSEAIYQLVIDGLPTEFPPIKAIDLRPNNLPAPVTPLVGRQEETAAALRLLRNSDVRLLTLTATGGTGKTRLSIHIASSLMGNFEDGIFFVRLAALCDPAQVIPAIAQTLSISETTNEPLAKTLADFLKNRELLLVLDNFEQVVDAAPFIADLLTSCPKLKVLATSRMALHLCGEQELPLPPLDLPDLDNLPMVEELSSVASVELFTQRAYAVKPSFALNTENAAAIATICTRLEGSPLAIELAAPHLRMMAPQMILSRLEKRLMLLSGGARDLPERHQTLRECIAWSYNLLEESEQKLLTQLAVFVGGFTVSAVEAVANANNNLAMLERMNLIKRVSDDDDPRFMMLERIREFAVEQLEASVDEKLSHQRHAAFFLKLAQQATPKIEEEGQEIWLQQLDADQYNLRAALGWMMEHEPQTALQLAGSLWHYWEVRGLFQEGLGWLRKSLDRNKDALQEGRTQALLGAGKLAWFIGDFDQASTWLWEALHSARATNNTEAIANSLSFLGNLATYKGDFQQSRKLLEESLSMMRRQEDSQGVATALLHLSHAVVNCLDLTRAQELLDESLHITRQRGDVVTEVTTLYYVGDLAMIQREHERARLAFHDGLDLALRIDERIGIGYIYFGLSWLSREECNYKAALDYLHKAKQAFHDIGHGWSTPFVLESLGYLAAAQKQYHQAALLLGASERCREDMNSPLVPSYHNIHNHYLQLLGIGLNETTLKQCWADGRALAPDDAVNLGFKA